MELIQKDLLPAFIDLRFRVRVLAVVPLSREERGKSGDVLYERRKSVTMKRNDETRGNPYFNVSKEDLGLAITLLDGR
jgi:hypothetical protein